MNKLRQKLIEELARASTDVNNSITSMFKQPWKPKELHDATKYIVMAGGKRLRPYLVLTSCEMVGGNREEALLAAASLEFIHNFTLVHDDIMDQDEKRRGVPTVHNLWGTPLAILVGDMLFAQAYETALSLKPTKVTPRKMLKILKIITKATISICEGQAQDIMNEEREMISESEYFDTISKKTATLLKASSKVGALIGGGNASQVRKLGQFAFYSGLAFQVVDDILGLTANEETLGKPVGSDIREGKKTLIIINALSHASKLQKEYIHSVLGRKTSLNQVHEIIQVLDSLGSIDYAFKSAEQLVEKAKKQLDSFKPSPAKENLLSLADYIISRKY